MITVYTPSAQNLRDACELDMLHVHLRASSVDHWRCSARSDRHWQGSALAAAPALLEQFTTRLPPQLLERLQIAAQQLGLRQDEIAVAAIDRFLTEYGF